MTTKKASIWYGTFMPYVPLGVGGFIQPVGATSFKEAKKVMQELYHNYWHGIYSQDEFDHSPQLQAAPQLPMAYVRTTL